MDEREEERGMGEVKAPVMNGEVMGMGMMFGTDSVWCRSPTPALALPGAEQVWELAR